RGSKGWSAHMADGSKPRAVSGEIMTDPSEHAAGRVPPAVDAGSVIDAEYVSVPSETPPGESTPREPLAVASPVAPPMAGMDMLRRPQEAVQSRRQACGGPLCWATGIGLAAAAFWISGGHALVRGASFIGAEAPHGALRISGVTSRVDASGP